MGNRPMTFDEERFSVNTAFLRKGGQHFEIVVDPDLAIAFRHSSHGDIREIVKSGHVFFDAKKGELASEQQMQSLFGSTDPFVVAEKIIKEGEIQLTKEYRDKLMLQKRKRILDLIHVNAIDPKNKLPHPITRLELAFEEAKIRIDPLQRAEDQINDIVRKLQPIIPIKFEKKILHIHIPHEHAAKVYSTLTNFGSIKRQEWLPDGSWSGDLELPAGLAVECIDVLNKRTHGAVNVTHGE